MDTATDHRSHASRSFRQVLVSLRTRGPLVGPFLCLIGTWIALRRGFLASTDIPLWDETEYLTAGWRLLHHGDASTLLPGSPLYLGWYALWHLIFADATVVLYAQWLTVDLAIVLATYLAVRASGAGRMAAYLVAAYWSVLSFSSDPPRVGFLAFLLVLCAGLCEYRGKRVATGILLAAAALVRPEYLLALPLWLAVQAWPAFNRKKRLVLACGLGVALALGMLATLSGAVGARLWTAFGQHYALRWAGGNPSVVFDPWTDYAQVIGHVFPGAASLGGALWVNPKEFLHFLLGNLAGYPGLLITLVPSPALLGDLLGPVLLLLLLLAVAVRRGEPPLPLWHITPVLALACLSVTVSLLVGPKAVYALPLVWLVLFGVARLARSLLPQDPLRRSWVVGTVWAVLAILPWALPAKPVRPLPAAENLVPLQALWSRQAPDTRWRMVEMDGGWCSYLDPDRCTSIWLWKKASSLSFSDFLRQEGANAVMVSPAFLRSLRVRHDGDFGRFRREPESFGFRAIRLTNDSTLYLRDPQPRPQ